ncbi:MULTISPECIES: polysaccharide deacetylase family protein [Streptomyces]|jgi:peptidoglycan/xylan/chitin deacetylase (PgdA/CDA1 family)|uniref:Polysaccharide deacetylase family protein n=2 Tax=Streptomyces griseoaurantiacus TaxID=68213 RepID=A0A7W2DW36_9ACTN|nr:MULTISPECIES: polysaccharide deacetylase family protein [Streptomyces]MBA5223971.1 polysaccharide deacetylase family protein [Streptomyces griseoaurantiacus]MCF0086832.1 Peptidoglycan-N-acetylglucosamine deacetylase [Streptomyces sp. MH192]MCF0099506.1 Peptidoglycan-N-acetylglucosamine deacetylase [Streptomyces sp. MH191]SDF60428.1 Peptidoglycan/xylan/chitin deacetylase, PgdA/CDA1 family [Streptomyces jietaisiensis]GHE60170.1 hydrolase [Streptomyces griseoaurantiacus]
MSRHGGRGWHGRVFVAAVGVTAAVTATALWTAGAGAAEGQKARDTAAHSTAPSDRAPAKVSVDIAHASDRGDRGVNITIDDGPDPTWTPQVLKVLEENGVKATFCMVGSQAEAHPDLVKAVVADGHRLCDHTVAHDVAMDKKPEAYQSQQILDAERMITEASGGVRPQYYRAPGGAFTPYSRTLAASRGMRPLGWNVDTKDFEHPGTAAIVATVKQEISNGPTVLFHDAGGDRAETVEALRQILPWLKEQGYTFGFPVR